MNSSFPRVLLHLLTLVMLGSCAFSRPITSTDSSLLQASNARWIKQIIPSDQKNSFDLFTLRNGSPAIGGVLSVYIEGDGHAWDGEFPSGDPTPRRAMGLDLGLNQPHGAVAYLARPCQYLGALHNPKCTPKAWTNERYSDEAVQALSHGVDVLKREVGAQKIVLIGFSGGAALAILIAAGRQDVIEIITVAGNIDTQGWVDYHQLRPLSGSLKPVDFLDQLQSIRQVHFVGGKDEVVPPFLTENLAKYYSTNMQFKVIPIQDNGHICCWIAQWPELWNRAISH
jgi:predicted esterase